MDARKRNNANFSHNCYLTIINPFCVRIATIAFWNEKYVPKNKFR